MLYEICDKGSFRNDSRYTLCDRKNDKRRRLVFSMMYAYLILILLNINIADKLMRFDTVSTVGYLCTVFHQHDNLRPYIHSILLPAIIRALSDPAEQVLLFIIYLC